MKDIHAVSIIVKNGDRFLLVQRGHPPSQGHYAFPGGRVNPGEHAKDAARRELAEETALNASDLSFFRQIRVPGENNQHYLLDIFMASAITGILQAGDDAIHAGWYRINDMESLPATESTFKIACELGSSNE